MTPAAPRRRLILMRHAKSSWAELGAPDHDRPLNQRGRLAAALMGAWLREQPWRVDLALISSSARTRETWGRMNVAAGAEQVREDLYHAEPPTLWAAAQSAPQSAESVLILAHNPGLEALLQTALRGPTRVPTGAVAVLEHSGDWASISPTTARVVAYEQPKGLV